MPPAIDVLVPGRPTVDVIFTRVREWPAPGREVYADAVDVSAGAHFNTAAALARLGLSVAFVAVVGADAWGERIVAELHAEGISDAYVEVVAEVPTPVSVALTFDGDRGFVSYAGGHDEAEDRVVSRSRALLESTEVRHVHGDLSASRRLVDAAAAAGATFSLDAHDAGDWLASDEVRALAGRADVVFVNELEAAAMTGAPTAEDGAAALAELARHVVLKRGARGSLAVVDRTVVEAPTAPVEVVDATGAGDCFAAGYLWGYFRGLPAATCLALGNLCGAAAVQVAGGYRGAPTLRELLAAVRQAGIELVA